MTWQVLLGQKYGYRPLPTIIPASELEMLCDVITRDQPGSADVQLLQQWYKKDDNSIEPIYVLQTISSIITNFKNKVIYAINTNKHLTIGVILGEGMWGVRMPHFSSLPTHKFGLQNE